MEAVFLYFGCAFLCCVVFVTLVTHNFELTFQEAVLASCIIFIASLVWPISSVMLMIFFALAGNVKKDGM